MSLFQKGEFILSSGLNSAFKIDADALTDEDIETVAWLINANLWMDFGWVVGVPRGGLRLAEALRKYSRPDKTDTLLIVDDVWTTGNSMTDYRLRHTSQNPQDIIGAVIFARNAITEENAWVLPLFTLWN